MRILHVATLVTPDGAYGGPVRVALNQCKALREHGHDAVLAAAYEGYESAPTEIDHVPVHLFPAHNMLPGLGFAGLTGRGMGAWLKSNIANFDAVHVHSARDFVTLPAARRALAADSRVVLQPHGMLDKSSQPLALPFDLRYTRPVLRRADAIFCLTQDEERLIDELEPRHAPVLAISNGLGAMGTTRPTASPPEILFVGRIAHIKRPLLFAQAAAHALQSGTPARFTLIGSDEGLGDDLRTSLSAAPSGVEWLGGLPHNQVMEHLSTAYALIQPSTSEVQSMTVLEAATFGVPAIVTRGNGLATQIAEREAGIVLDVDDPVQLAREIHHLVGDPARRAELGANARIWVEEQFTSSAMIDALIQGYSQRLESRP